MQAGCGDSKDFSTFTVRFKVCFTVEEWSYVVSGETVTCMVCVRKLWLLSPRQVCRLSSLCHLSSVISSRDIFNVIVHKHSRSILLQCQAQVEVSGVTERATFWSPGWLWWPSYVPLVFVVTLCFGLVHLVATHSMAPTCCDEEICLFRLYLGRFPPWKSTICSLLLANHTPYIFLTRTWSPRQTLNFKCCMFSLLL